jgi:hypothetical protein
MKRKIASSKTLLGAVTALGLFGAGFLAGANQYQKPKSILHLVAVKWTEDSTPEQRKAAIEGVEKMAAQIPGIKRIWLKSLRVQPSDFNNAFAIEFEDQAAADRYGKDPGHEAWYKVYLPVHDQSRSFQVTN